MADEMLTLEEAGKILGLGRNTMYTLANDGSLGAVKLGASWRISRERLEEIKRKGIKK